MIAGLMNFTGCIRLQESEHVRYQGTVPCYFQEKDFKVQTYGQTTSAHNCVPAGLSVQYDPFSDGPVV